MVDSLGEREGMACIRERGCGKRSQVTDFSRYCGAARRPKMLINMLVVSHCKVIRSASRRPHPVRGVALHLEDRRRKMAVVARMISIELRHRHQRRADNSSIHGLPAA